MSNLAAIQRFLLCPTPEGWLQNALAEPELLLIDHANCEQVSALGQWKEDYCFVA